MSDYLWVEKYRPRKIEDCILSQDIKETFSQFLSQKEIPNLLLSGTAGTDQQHRQGARRCFGLRRRG